MVATYALLDTIEALLYSFERSKGKEHTPYNVEVPRIIVHLNPDATEEPSEDHTRQERRRQHNSNRTTGSVLFFAETQEEWIKRNNNRRGVTSVGKDKTIYMITR